MRAKEEQAMDIDWDKVDEVTLALMQLTTFQNKTGSRTWKGHEWNVLEKLHEKGWISNPVTKAKSVVWSEQGRRLSEALFEKHFKKVV
jgi:hypothetical protein